MAKQAKNGSAADSGFDFSRFLDLDEDDSPVSPSTDTGGFDYNTIPHSEDEIVTGAIDLDLETAVDNYIRAGKVSWGDKRTLRRLAKENSDLESALRDADREILSRASGYHVIVSNILREKNDQESFALDDNDPYDAEPVVHLEESLGSQAARIQSSDLFKEIESLEGDRSELNAKRIGILEEIQEIYVQGSEPFDVFEELDEIVSQKLEAILKVHDITKTTFSSEDEALFDKGVEDLTGYIHGAFDPLAEEDEYDEEEDSPVEIPLEQVESGSTTSGAFSSEESPEALFAAFGADTFDPEPQTEDEDIAIPEDVRVDDVQAEITEDQEVSEHLSTVTEPISIEDIPTPEANVQDELEDELERKNELIGDIDSDTETQDEAASELEVDETVGDDLSDEDLEDASPDENFSPVAEMDSWNAEADSEDSSPAEFISEDLDDASYSDSTALEVKPESDCFPEAIARFEGEGGSSVSVEDEHFDESDDAEFTNSEFTEDDSYEKVYEEDYEEEQEDLAVMSFIDSDPVDNVQVPVRAVLFEQLKAKYGMTFSFEDQLN